MKINGYTLKAVKMMDTPDGISYSGNIYYDGKKIGMAYNDGRGGMTDVDLHPDYRDHYSVLDEDFVERLFTLNDYEKMFKDNQKKHPNTGLAFVMYTDYCDLGTIRFGGNVTMDEIKGHAEKTKPGWAIESIELFRSPDDFIIDQDHQPEIYRADDSEETEDQGMTGMEGM